MIPDPATLRSLLARVEKGQGADREIDLALWHDVQGERRPGAGLRTNLGAVPRYTGSIDAAVALIKRMVPEWSWGVSVEPPTHGVTYHAFVGSHFPGYDGPPGRWWGEASYVDGAPVALCAALLRALIARAQHEAIDDMMRTSQEPGLD